MPRQKRTTKILAQKIDLSYFKRQHPFRRWRVCLSVAAPAAALLWLGGLALARRDTVYSAGPVSSAHAVFGARCELCHGTGHGRGFSKAVSDDNCRSCHDGPVHQVNQVFTPSCSACHGEHQQRTRLERVSDTDCTQCHSSLETTNGVHRFDPRILSFDGVHPEFRASQPGFTDPGTVKLNHEVHLKAGLKASNGTVTMECGDCHRVPSQASAWPYGTAEFRSAAKTSSDRPTAPLNNAYMTPIAYAKHCYACHVLLFDKRFVDPVPHDKPEVVHKFLVQRYSDYIAANPAEVHNVSPPMQRIPQQPELPLPRTPQEWVTFQVAQAELLLWQKTCKECHTVVPTSGPLPEIAKSAITPRWFRNGAFDHQPHRMLDCTACHSRALHSRETSDVLLPGIKLCQQCHRSEDKTPHESAEARCFECHTYHDWSKERPVKGKYGIRQIVEGGAPPVSAGSAGALIP